jgi:hypothetical protein
MLLFQVSLAVALPVAASIGVPRKRLAVKEAEVSPARCFGVALDAVYETSNFLRLTLARFRFCAAMCVCRRLQRLFTTSIMINRISSSVFLVESDRHECC